MGGEDTVGVLPINIPESASTGTCAVMDAQNTHQSMIFDIMIDVAVFTAVQQRLMPMTFRGIKCDSWATGTQIHCTDC